MQEQAEVNVELAEPFVSNTLQLLVALEHENLLCRCLSCYCVSRKSQVLNPFGVQDSVRGKSSVCWTSTSTSSVTSAAPTCSSVAETRCVMAACQRFRGSQERSLIFLEFPDARRLLAALQEFLKRAQRLFLYKARKALGRFLADLWVLARFEIDFELPLTWESTTLLSSFNINWGTATCSCGISCWRFCVFTTSSAWQRAVGLIYPLLRAPHVFEWQVQEEQHRPAIPGYHEEG